MNTDWNPEVSTTLITKDSIMVKDSSLIKSSHTIIDRTTSMDQIVRAGEFENSQISGSSDDSLQIERVDEPE